MNKTRKVLTIIAVATMSISVLMLILAVFKVNIFNSIALNFLLSFATISVASAFAINALNILKRQKIIPCISLILLGISTLFGLINYWTNFSNLLFARITAILAIATAFFCIIVSLNNKIQKKYLALQIVTYLIIVFINIVLSLLISGVNVFNMKGFAEIFFVACLVAFGLLCALAILGKKKDNLEEIGTVIKEKYNTQQLLNRIKELEAENAELKEKLNLLQNS